MDAVEKQQDAWMLRSLAAISTEPNRDLAKKFIADRTAKPCKRGTLANYAYALRLLDNATAGCPYRDVTRDGVAQTLATLSLQMGPNSLKGIGRSLLAFYHWLYEDVAIPRSFLKAFQVRAEHAQHHLVSDAEFQALLEAADYGPAYALRTLRDQAILHLLRDTGMRRAELVSLNHDSVEVDPAGGAWVTPPRGAPRLKTGSRPVLTIRAWPALHALLSAQPGGMGEPVYRSFSDRTHGRRLWPAEVGRIVTRLRRRAGIQRVITPHDFRHTEATDLARKGWNQELMNKKLWTPGSKMSAIYVHLDRTDLAARSRADAGADPLGRAVQTDPQTAIANAVSAAVAATLQHLKVAPEAQR